MIHLAVEASLFRGETQKTTVSVELVTDLVRKSVFSDTLPIVSTSSFAGSVRYISHDVPLDLLVVRRAKRSVEIEPSCSQVLVGN